MIVTGITGTNGAGKGTVVDYLVQRKGLIHYSARAFITEEVKRRGLAVNRDTMVEVGNDLRAQYGSGYIILSLYQQAKREGKNAIIESIRTLGEVEELKYQPVFFLLGVDADPRLRYERVCRRGSETDVVSFEEFLAHEEREMENSDPTKQNIRAVMSRADAILDNNGSIEALHQQMEGVV